MKKLLSSTLALAMLWPAGAWSQTDVTDTYLRNADFREGPVTTVDVRGYGKDMTAGDVYSMQPVEGWTIVEAGATDSGFDHCGIAGAVFAYGSSNQLRGGNLSAPASGPSGEASGNALGLFAVWGESVQYTQAVTLPAGFYTLSVPVFNVGSTATRPAKGLIGFIADGGTEYLAAPSAYTTGVWQTETVTFQLDEETAGVVSLGYRSAGSGSGSAPHLFFDRVSLVYTTASPQTVVVDGDEVVLTLDAPTAQLTASVLPASAPQEVTWESDDEQVVRVSNGVLTAVGAGETVVTAISVVDESVYEQVRVVVEPTYIEVPAPEASYVDQDAVRSKVDILSENLIANGGFEYWPDSKELWTNATDFISPLPESKFRIGEEEDGNHYLVGTVNDGAAGEGSIGMAWHIEGGKSYLFTFRVKSLRDNVSGSQSYLKTSLTNVQGEEQLGLGTPTLTANEWTTVSLPFTNVDDYAYLQVKFRWLNGQFGFDDFSLVEVEMSEEGNVEYVQQFLPQANIGSGVFQYDESLVARLRAEADRLVQGEASVDDVKDVAENIQDNLELNAPEDGQLFRLVQTFPGWTYDHKAATFIAGGRTDAGEYSISYLAEPNDNLAQAFTFTPVYGEKDSYLLSQVDADGEVRYVCTGTTYGGDALQVRTTLNEEEAAVFTVKATGREGVYNLFNVAANQYIGSQDAGFYTVNSHIDFFLEEASRPTVAVDTRADGVGTVILPFDAEVPAGVKAYRVEAFAEGLLTLEEVAALEANKPYLLLGRTSVVLSGDAEGAQLSYADGLLTGVYAQTPAPEGSYVLQGDTFAAVAEGEEHVVAPNQAYLTVKLAEGEELPEGEVLPEVITAVRALAGNVLPAGTALYNLAGQQVAKAVRGVYVREGRKVVVR